MSAWVVEYEHIAAMVNVADCHAGHQHTQFDWYATDADGETVRYTLSRSGVDEIEDAYTTTGDYHYAYPKHVTVALETLGGMLLAENVRSVGYRYGTNDPSDLPGPIAQDNTIYRHDGTIHLNPVATLKSIQCYEYQTCEHPAWATSPAKAFCEALTSAVIKDLPGYEDAPWGIDAGNVKSVAV